MDATIRATCPTCQSSLKIPAHWAGQAVKCKKCGAIVRTKAAAAPPPGDPAPPAPAYGAVPAPSPFADLAPAAPRGGHNPFDDHEAHAGPPHGYDPHAYPPPAAAPAYPYPMPAAPPAYPYPVAAPQAALPAYLYPAPPSAYPPADPYPHPAAPAYPQPVAAAYPHPVAAAPPAPYPAYPYPQPAGPAAGAVADEFTPSEAASSHRGRGRYRRGGGPGQYVWIGVCLVLTAGLAVGGVFGFKYIQSHMPNTPAGGTEGGHAQGQPGTPKPPAPQTQMSGGNFPRRLLFMHVSNYLYLNPLTSRAQQGESMGGDKTQAAAKRLGFELRVPMDKDNYQLYLLSDTAPPPDDRFPMKSVITGTYEKFFDTSRGQDRIMVYFGGHVLSKKKDDKEAVYLVPIEGDPDDEASLIPLDDFYGKLKACKAAQKVVVWDVCRYNPERGRLRPGSEPMTEAIATALSATPPGVQAVLTCQPGENALEFNYFEPEGRQKSFVAGSNFLEAAKFVNEKFKPTKAVEPNDPFPVDEWAKAVGKRAAEVGDAYPDGRPKQTVKAVGPEPAKLAPFNKEEAFAAKFDYPPAPKGASPEERNGIVRELTLPGLKKDEIASGVSDFPFPAEALLPYKGDGVSLTDIMADKEKYEFRAATLDAYETIHKVWKKGDVGTSALRTKAPGKITDAVKKEVLGEQEYFARAGTLLEAAIVRLELAETKREGEPKRWQVHHDYALAQCKLRLAYLAEYNLALGNIRTETMPALDEKKGLTEYKLVPSATMKAKKEKKVAEEAQELFEKVVTENKGSPWAIEAKRYKVEALGLAWQPVNPNAADAKDMP